MKKQDKQNADYLRQAMQQAKGDSLERANYQFSRWSDTKLDEPYGQSGRTGRQVWQGHKDARASWKAANAFLEQMLSVRRL